MFKIAYGAGHIYSTAGKRLPKELDPKETREWTLNDRVARHFAAAAAQYEGVELLRVDDPNGVKNIDLEARCKAANDWGADFCLAIHHNAGAKLTRAGGIVAYILKKGSTAETFQKAIYNACIAAGGLKGNRSTPLATANFYVLRKTNAPAVLMEYGFMDSTADAPVILKDEYSKLVAYATMDGIAKAAGLKKKAAADNVEKPAEQKPAEKQLYRIRKTWADKASQVGAFENIEYAKAACPVGYSIFDKDGNVVYTTRVKVDYARDFNKALAGTYIVNSKDGQNLRAGASTSKAVLEVMQDGAKVKCYGYYTKDWLYVVSESGTKGFAHNSLLEKV